MIHTTTCVQRIECGKKEIPLSDVVVGDIIHLSAGDMLSGDLRIIYAKDLFISQASLSGESEPIEKFTYLKIATDNLIDYSNLAFMGCNVLSGSAIGIVVNVGKDTLLGNLAKDLNKEGRKTSFELGLNSVSWLLIRYMLIMVPIVLFINGFTKGNWLEASLFALSIAVGLTPEMLPMIVTTALAKGSITLGKKKVIIKNLSAIQNLGSIDILCTDKTGTLTLDKISLQHHLDVHGKEDHRVLRHAYLNSYYQSGLKNLIDLAIINKYEELYPTHPATFFKVDEIPFDFNRRLMSVVVIDEKHKTQMITKGAVEEMLKCCSYVEYNGIIEHLNTQLIQEILDNTARLNAQGMRVIAIAQKNNPSPVNEFGIKDEKDMVLIGYLAFLDPPKKSAASAIKALNNYGVEVKIVTGDNEKVTCCICEQVGIKVNRLMLGVELDSYTDGELEKNIDEINVFAKMSPAQKERIILLLRKKHVVGYMGDGINDALSLKASDVGISVDSAVDIAKESADVILLEKDLMVLEAGIIEGRKTYANMIKYIKMTASSNFGNMFSVLVASSFLPFLPMAAIHLIILNLIYDISCSAIPWDNVDCEYLLKPRKWDASSISKFMLCIGPTSSIFDITTYLLMYFIICPSVCGGLMFHQISDPNMQMLFISTFQAGWFIESMWSQTLVIHMIRTPKIPFIQSRASLSVCILTFLGILTLTCIPFTPLSTYLGLAPLPLIYFAYLAVTIIAYMLVVTLAKKIYISKYHELL